MPGSKRKALELVADRVIEDEPTQKDTHWVKLVEIRSKLLSDFHGREIKLRGAVVLPETYYAEPDQQFPTLYSIPGFSGDHTSAFRRFIHILQRHFKSQRSHPESGDSAGTKLL